MLHFLIDIGGPWPSFSWYFEFQLQLTTAQHITAPVAKLCQHTYFFKAALVIKHATMGEALLTWHPRLLQASNAVLKPSEETAAHRAAHYAAVPGSMFLCKNSKPTWQAWSAICMQLTYNPLCSWHLHPCLNEAGSNIIPRCATHKG